jgi:hypothetical protein
VARHSDAGHTPDPRDAIVAAAIEAGVAIEPTSEADLRLDRTVTTFRGISGVVLTGDRPIEVRAYGPLGRHRPLPTPTGHGRPLRLSRRMGGWESIRRERVGRPSLANRRRC